MGFSDEIAIQETANQLERLVGLPIQAIEPGPQHLDARVRLGPYSFLVEWKSASDTLVVTRAIQLLRHANLTGSADIPLIAVPHMGAAGRKICNDLQVSWIDLSGNANIQAPGLRLLIEGRPNAFKRPGRPSSVFAPKSARIARWFLLHPHTTISQRELARESGLTEGFVSKVVSRLEEEELLARQEGVKSQEVV